jgi:hypothetical protein
MAKVVRPKGMPKTGGRKKGTPNKIRAADIKAKIAMNATLAGLTPLEFMLALMRDETQSIAFRADMANKAAPYVHQKLIATDNTNRRPPPRTDQSIAELRDELLQDMVEAGLVTLLPVVLPPRDGEGFRPTYPTHDYALGRKR